MDRNIRCTPRNEDLKTDDAIYNKVFSRHSRHFNRFYLYEYVNKVPVEKLDLGYGQSVYLITREGWGALPPDMTPLKTPIARVRFTYTGMATCKDANECAAKTKELETFYRNKGYPDLPYNFLVGGDGRAYEGGGWNFDTEKTPKHMWLKGKTISIAYMGNFGKESPPYELLTVAMDLIKYGMKVKHISTLFKLVPYWSPMMNAGHKHKHKDKKKAMS